jgi:hypothetical protein
MRGVYGSGMDIGFARGWWRAPVVGVGAGMVLRTLTWV